MSQASFTSSRRKAISFSREKVDPRQATSSESQRTQVGSHGASSRVMPCDETVTFQQVVPRGGSR